MDNLVELGFQSRRKFQEDLELSYFREWCKENHLNPDNETYDAEILWEMALSKFKGIEHSCVCC